MKLYEVLDMDISLSVNITLYLAYIYFKLADTEKKKRGKCGLKGKCVLFNKKAIDQLLKTI